VTYNTFYPDLSTPDEKKHPGDSNLLKRDRFTPWTWSFYPVDVIVLQQPWSVCKTPNTNLEHKPRTQISKTTYLTIPYTNNTTPNLSEHIHRTYYSTRVFKTIHFGQANTSEYRCLVKTFIKSTNELFKNYLHSKRSFWPHHTPKHPKSFYLGCSTIANSKSTGAKPNSASSSGKDKERRITGLDFELDELADGPNDAIHAIMINTISQLHH